MKREGHGGERRGTFADVALLDQAPEHVGAMVAVSGLVKGLLGEAVPVTRRALRRRHHATVCLSQAQRAAYMSTLSPSRT